MPKFPLLPLIAALAVPVAQAAAPAPKPPAEGTARPLLAQALGCLIEPERVVEVGSPVIGVLSQVEVERGASVKKGQVLAVLRADVERASLNAAQLRAAAEAEVQAAATSAAFNKERLVRAEELFTQNYISQQALQQARTEARLADQKLAQAVEQRRIVQQEREVAAAQLGQRTIRSPIDGVVAERYLSAGERVDDKPLMRIAKVNPLRVQLVVPILQYGQLRVGGSASVTPELPGAAARNAKVTLVDRVVDPASNTFRVHLELPNADHALPAGLRCRAEYALGPMAATALGPAGAGLEPPPSRYPEAAPVRAAQVAASKGLPAVALPAAAPAPVLAHAAAALPAMARAGGPALHGLERQAMAQRYVQALQMNWRVPAPALPVPTRNHRGVALAWLDDTAMTASRTGR